MDAGIAMANFFSVKALEVSLGTSKFKRFESLND
jgi:hypothetical protein